MSSRADLPYHGGIGITSVLASTTQNTRATTVSARPPQRRLYRQVCVLCTVLIWFLNFGFFTQVQYWCSTYAQCNVRL